MPTIVDILTFISRIIFIFHWVEHANKGIASSPVCYLMVHVIWCHYFHWVHGLIKQEHFSHFMGIIDPMYAFPAQLLTDHVHGSLQLNEYILHEYMAVSGSNLLGSNAIWISDSIQCAHAKSVQEKHYAGTITKTVIDHLMAEPEIPKHSTCSRRYDAFAKTAYGSWQMPPAVKESEVCGKVYKVYFVFNQLLWWLVMSFDLFLSTFFVNHVKI